MARWRVLAWRDLPAAVEASDGEETLTLPLSERFQALIDSAAMQAGREDAGAYLEEWRRLEGGDRPGRAREVAEAVVAELEARFGEYQARALGRA